MEDQEIIKESRYNNAIIRVHIPDHGEKERIENIKKATETFLKKILMQEGK